MPVRDSPARMELPVRASTSRTTPVYVRQASTETSVRTKSTPASSIRVLMVLVKFWTMEDLGKKSDKSIFFSFEHLHTSDQSNQFFSVFLLFCLFLNSSILVTSLRVLLIFWLISFRCKCNNGFQGDRCETNIDDCKGHACMNNGSCIDLVEGYTCQCGPGYTGIAAHFVVPLYNYLQ